MCRLRQLCDEEKTVAVGEIGLDYYWNKEDHETQKKWFVRQMDLAKETKPVSYTHLTFDDFMKMQFQVGEIIACEEVKKSKKLLCSQVKIGSQVKQIVSGIKSNYKPEDMVGKKVMVLVNLKPAKLAGIVSEGMILCAEGFDGELALMTPDKDMPQVQKSVKKRVDSTDYIVYSSF